MAGNMRPDRVKFADEMSGEELRVAVNNFRQGARELERRGHDQRRFVWEPVVTHSAEEIESEPMCEEEAMDSLLEQACQCPPQHYSPAHECDIPRRRLQCLREIQRWRRHRDVFEVMASTLPKELVLHILDYVVQDTQPHLDLRHKLDLPHVARTLIGDSPVAEKLIYMTEEAILNNSLINLDITFRNEPSGKVAILPRFAAYLPHSIHHLELRIDLDIAFDRQTYPTALFSPTAGMKSLLSNLQQLRTLQLTVTTMIPHNPMRPGRAPQPSDVLGLICRKGFSDTTTYRQAIADLLDSARGKGHELFLLMQYDFDRKWEKPWSGRPLSSYVELGDRTALDVVEEVDPKRYW